MCIVNNSALEKSTFMKDATHAHSKERPALKEFCIVTILYRGTYLDVKIHDATNPGNMTGKIVGFDPKPLNGLDIGHTVELSVDNICGVKAC